ncbi:MAG: helix-turn-helix transcriptional regulator [Spirochaetes bacterium]|nr:helix-turn-helix transcriptional regulator [Spirochaetota bacterium]
MRESRKEFQEKGFAGANIRDIANKSNVSIGNIYNYFPNKDAIFHEIVKPTLTAIEKTIKIYSEMNYLDDDYQWSLEYHLKFVDQIANFLDSHRENLKLILFKSEKSKLGSFKEDFLEWYTELMNRNMAILKKEFPDEINNISDFFIHTVTSFYLNVVIEILMHDLKLEEMQKNLRELMMFLYHGWDSLMNNEKIILRIKAKK